MAFNSVLAFTFLIISATASYTTTTITTSGLHIDDTITAIISAGNFQNWAHLLSSDPTLLPPNSTLFVPLSAPKNTTLVSYNQDSPFHTNSQLIEKTREQLRSYFLLLYHIVPHRLSFFELVQLPIHARLPTLLPGHTLVITGNYNIDSVSCKFAIDGSCITRPDLYKDDSVFVHGVKSVLEYTVYGDEMKTIPTEERPFSWTELWRESWGFLLLLLLVLFVTYLFNPFLVAGDDNNDHDDEGDHDDDEGDHNDDDGNDDGSSGDGDGLDYDDLIEELEDLVIDCYELQQRAMNTMKECMEEMTELQDYNEGDHNDDDSDDLDYDDLINEFQYLATDCYDLREWAVETMKECVEEKTEYERQIKAIQEEYQRILQQGGLR